MTAPKHDMQAIERALEHHRTRGAIRSWVSLWPASGYRWRVELTSGTVELRSLREAHVFAAALASAGQATPRTGTTAERFAAQVAALDPDATDYEDTLRTLIGRAREVRQDAAKPAIYTRDQVSGAAGAARELVRDGLGDHGISEREIGLVSMVVNATMTLLDNPGVSGLDTVLDACCTGGAAAVRSWWGGWA